MSLHLPLAKPGDLNIDSQQLDATYELLKQWTTGESPVIPGAAVAVGRRGRLLEPRYFGRQHPGKDEKIRRDGLFLLASITKPMTYLAALMLVERGLLNLSDRVSHHLPEFAANGKHEVRVHHLFTHTSGLPDMLPNNTELRRAHAPLSVFVEDAVKRTKLDFEPGANHQYQSMGTLVVAELVHQISGKMIAEFLQEEVLAPLQMKSTSLGLGRLDPERLVSVEIPDYAVGSDFHWNSPYWRKFGAPWGGMFSSPEDMAVVCQTMLGGGEHDDVRLWSPATIRRATTNRLHDYAEMPESIRRSKPWGLGWQMNAPASINGFSDLLGKGVFGHTGATGTMVWMDRERDGFCILLTTAIRSKAPWRLVALSNMIAAAFR